MAEAWLFKGKILSSCEQDWVTQVLSAGGSGRRDVPRWFTGFFNLILQSQLLNPVLPYFLLSRPYWGDFSSLFLPAVLSWQLLPPPLPALTRHGPCQGTRRTRNTTCTRSRKRTCRKHLETGWSQGRLESGTKLKSMFNPSFSSRRRLANILYGHYKCLYFTTCYTAASTTSTFLFPWYLEKHSFWRIRVPLRSCLRRCHHLAQGSPLCSMKRRNSSLVAAYLPAFQNRAKKLWETPRKTWEQIRLNHASWETTWQHMLSSVSPVQV